jgi:hypothetical protein
LSCFCSDSRFAKPVCRASILFCASAACSSSYCLSSSLPLEPARSAVLPPLPLPSRIWRCLRGRLAFAVPLLARPSPLLCCPSPASRLPMHFQFALTAPSANHKAVAAQFGLRPIQRAQQPPSLRWPPQTTLSGKAVCRCLLAQGRWGSGSCKLSPALRAPLSSRSLLLPAPAAAPALAAPEDPAPPTPVALEVAAPQAPVALEVVVAPAPAAPEIAAAPGSPPRLSWLWFFLNFMFSRDSNLLQNRGGDGVQPLNGVRVTPLPWVHGLQVLLHVALRHYHLRRRRLGTLRSFSLRSAGALIMRVGINLGSPVDAEACSSRKNRTEMLIPLAPPVCSPDPPAPGMLIPRFGSPDCNTHVVARGHHSECGTPNTLVISQWHHDPGEREL